MDVTGSICNVAHGCARAQEGVWGGAGLQGVHAGRFRSSFVPSGVAGGDIGAKATIVAPRVAPSKPVPPPPPPMIAPPASAYVSPAPQRPAPAADAVSSAAAQAVSPLAPPHSPSSVLLPIILLSFLTAHVRCKSRRCPWAVTVQWGVCQDC